MKKLFLVFLLFVVAMVFTSCTKKEEAKSIDKDIVLQSILAPKQVDWEISNMKAKKLDSEGLYLESAQQYLMTCSIARAIKDGYTDSRSAWALNNAAYMVIKYHKKFNTWDLSNAEKWLLEAGSIEKASEECIKCIESNMAYIRDQKLKLPVKVVTPEGK